MTHSHNLISLFYIGIIYFLIIRFLFSTDTQTLAANTTKLKYTKKERVCANIRFKGEQSIVNVSYVIGISN